MAAIYPDLVGLKKVTGSATASNVAAGGSSDVTVTLDSDKLIIGIPYVSTSTANAEVIIVNGGSGGNSFVVRATNNGASAQNIAIDYTVYVVDGA